jgi:thioredoxin-related protein
MKKIIFLLAIIAFSNNIKAQEINWISLNEALELQKETPKKIMIDVYTNWCGPCKLLDKKTFHNKDVVAFVNKHYYAVKFNGEGDEMVNYKEASYGNPNYDKRKANKRNSAHEFANFMGVNAYPTIVFLNEKSDLIIPLRGFHDAQQLEFYLKIFINDTHKTLTSQAKFDTYYNAFKPVFKN